jgi:hypothetical protein
MTGLAGWVLQRVVADYRGPGSLPLTPPPSPLNKLDKRLRKKDNLLWERGEESGKEPNHMMARKPGPL